MTCKSKITAIILSAGNGTRMNSSVAKQYIIVNEKPILYYTIKAFEESSVDEIVIAAKKADYEYIINNIINKYGFKKVTKVIEGGEERYFSVYNALNAVNGAEYVLIHDGARPLISAESIEAVISCVKEKKACVLAVRAKDTIKISDNNGFILSTPDRNTLWQIQTPQAFSYEIVKSSYDNAMKHYFKKDNRMNLASVNITDDSMVVEQYSGKKVAIVEGEYKNIKITTKEDIEIMKAFLDNIRT